MGPGLDLDNNVNRFLQMPSIFCFIPCPAIGAVQETEEGKVNVSFARVLLTFLWDIDGWWLV